MENVEMSFLRQNLQWTHLARGTKLSKLGSHIPWSESVNEVDKIMGRFWPILSPKLGPSLKFYKKKCTGK